MYHFQTQSKKILADRITPVILYLKLRDKFAGSILLESSDYASSTNSYSFIACDSIAEFKLDDENLTEKFPDGTVKNEKIKRSEVLDRFNSFTQSFKSEKSHSFINNGLFGYMNYDSVKYFENIELKNKDYAAKKIPEIWYRVFRYVFVFNHYKNEIYIFKHSIEKDDQSTTLDDLLVTIFDRNYPNFSFSQISEESSSCSDDEYLNMVKGGISHCKRGDVFQVVLSRRFSSQFKGDEFNVYRALRSVNPSPYLFYFDYIDFRLFGSSPEMQIMANSKTATIAPIAGTYPRDNSEISDELLAKKLRADVKEKSEHTMLVDLARNDLSKHAKNVRISKDCQLQYYSHLVHIVSEVTGELFENTSSINLFADTFPAGTLSGAPKYRAMEIINDLESEKRSYYGGAIGWWGFEGSINQAIMIRTFLSQDNVLTYQAGAGIVNQSVPEKELTEINNKLGALRRAIEIAKDL